MRKIIIRSDLPGYVDIEVELQKWLTEKIENEKVRITREETDNVITYRIAKVPEKERISSEDFERVLRNIRGQSLEDALNNALRDILKNTERHPLPDDGLPF